ncbi:MAG: riboflavin biosynthesis protein RibF [Clostridia bacterium]|nr:riboflavin biosynthesis protein RibF [Clostridia bacterium]
MEIIKYRYGDDTRDYNEIASHGTAIALGLFDGVHIGHRRLICEAVRMAKERGLLSGVFTFSTEDGLKAASPRIYSTKQKLALISELGVDFAIVCDFSSIKKLSATDFIEEVLTKAFNCQVALSGYNFRFGRGAVGNAEMLKATLQALGREAFILDEQRYDGLTLSSTEIRAALAQGDTERASRMLGLPYFIEGEVERGLGLGHKFGFPTINNELPEGCPLQTGVYIVVVPIGENLYTGLCNVGICPTFGERAIHAETMLLDFEGDLYGKRLVTYFISYLRAERVFPSGEELKAQIDRDAQRAAEIDKKKYIEMITHKEKMK